MIARYALIGLALLLAAAGVKLYFAQAEIAELQLAAERLDKQHQQQLIDKLQAQREAFDQVLRQESDRKKALEVRNVELLKQVAALADYGDRLAESLRVVLNGMFQHPPGETGRLVPARPGLSAGGGSPACETLAAWRPEF